MKRKSSLFLFILLLASLNYAGSNLVQKAPVNVTGSPSTFIANSFNMVEFDSGNTPGLFDSILYYFDLNATGSNELLVDIYFYDNMGYYLNGYFMNLGNEVLGLSTYSANIPADFLYQLYYNGSMSINFYIRESNLVNGTSTNLGSATRTLLFNYQNYELPEVYPDFSNVIVTPYDDDLGIYNPTCNGCADGIIVQVNVTQSLPGTVELDAYFYENQTYSYSYSIGDTGSVYQSTPGTYLHEIYIPGEQLSKLNGTFEGTLWISGSYYDDFGNYSYIPSPNSFSFIMNSSLFEANTLNISITNVFELDNNQNGLTNEIVVTVMLNSTKTRLYYLEFYGYLDMYYLEGQVQYSSNNSVVVGNTYTYVNITLNTMELYNMSISSSTLYLYLDYNYEMIHFPYSTFNYTSIGQFSITNLKFDSPPVMINSVELIGMYNPALGLDAGFDYMEVRLNITSSISSWIEFSIGIYDSFYWSNLYGVVINEWFTQGNYSLSFFIDGSTVYSFNHTGPVSIDSWVYYDYNGSPAIYSNLFSNNIDSNSYNPSGQYVPATNSSSSSTTPSNSTSTIPSSTSNSTSSTSSASTASSTSLTSLTNSTSSITNSTDTSNSTNNAPPTPELPLPAPSFWLTITSFAMMMIVVRRRKILN